METTLPTSKVERKTTKTALQEKIPNQICGCNHREQAAKLQLGAKTS